jgi:hypothetical protein
MNPSSGANIAEADANKVLDSITIMQNTYTSQIDNEISNINKKLRSLTTTTVIAEINKFIQDMNTQLLEVKGRHEQNNAIMGRQQGIFDKINKEFAGVVEKDRNIKDLDEKAKINMDIVKNTNNQLNWMTMIYKILILVLVVFLAYLLYSTVVKFKTNIYEKYLD